MKYLKLKTEKIDSLDDFISHWRVLYGFGDEKRYKQNIVVKIFSRENLQELFHWKNGMVLSGGKKKSLEQKILKKIDVINRFKVQEKFEVNEFWATFKDLSAVWKIFLLHTIKPNTYPIYDQHIHRTFNFLSGGDWQNVKNTMNNAQKEEFYKNTYLPFIKKSNVQDLKALDEAFFAFGQFLNTRVQSNLLVK